MPGPGKGRDLMTCVGRHRPAQASEEAARIERVVNLCAIRPVKATLDPSFLRASCRARRAFVFLGAQRRGWARVHPATAVAVPSPEGTWPGPMVSALSRGLERVARGGGPSGRKDPLACASSPSLPAWPHGTVWLRHRDGSAIPSRCGRPGRPRPVVRSVPWT